MISSAVLPAPRAAVARLPGVRIEQSTRAPVRAPDSGVPLFVGFVADAPDGAARGHSLADRYRAALGPRVDDAWDRGFDIGMTDQPVLAFDRWEHYADVVGGKALGFLDYAVRGFFENGGGHCKVVVVLVFADAAAFDLQQTLQWCFRPGGPLDDVADPDLVCVPDAVWGALGRDVAAVAQVQRAIVGYCNRLNDRMAILDCLPTAPNDTQGSAYPADAERAQARIASGRDGSGDGEAADAPGQVANGAMYWPWIAVRPLPRDANPRPIVPPCGHIAGVYARLDAATGRHKAPANERLEGALDVDDEVSVDALADLNDGRTNALRPVVGRGVRVSAARTLSTQVAWRYVNVRRVVLAMARWAELGLRDLVMETHDPALWQRLRHRVETYCLDRYHEGALRGSSPAEAFYVKCDAENNPAASRELGRVVCEVGLAIATPAEFIVVQLVPSIEGTALHG